MRNPRKQPFGEQTSPVLLASCLLSLTALVLSTARTNCFFAEDLRHVYIARLEEASASQAYALRLAVATTRQGLVDRRAAFCVGNSLARRIGIGLAGNLVPSLAG